MDSIMPIIIPLALAFFVSVIIGAVSFLSKLKTTRDQIDSLARRLSRLELHVLDLQKPVEPAATPSEASSAGNVLLRQRETDRSPLEPLIPVPPSSDIPVSSPPKIESETAIPSIPAPILPPLISSAANVADSPSPSGYIPPSLPIPPKSSPAINWEQFMGVKLFAWIGGFALFLGVAFFIKYSFERNLIPPEARAAIGFLFGMSLLIGGIFLKRRELAVTSHTLCATGVVILYAVTFACRSVYHFDAFGPFLTFLLMVVITATAFMLAVRLEARVVAVLGLVGGFLTPILLSTGHDNPGGLFTYVALLDLGLAAVAFKRRWHFLVLLGAIGTVLMQIGWVLNFFEIEKVFIAMAVFLGFDLLFLLAFAAGEKLKQSNDWVTSAAVVLPFATLAFVFTLLFYPRLGDRPGVLFSFVLGADLALLAMVLLRPALHEAHLGAGALAFLELAIWTSSNLTEPLLNWALGLSLSFGALHALFPIILARYRPEARRIWLGQLFAPLALLMMLIPLLKEETVSFLIWPAVFLADLLAIALALLTASAATIFAAVLITSILTGVWIGKMPSDATELAPLLVVIGAFAIFFFGAGLYARKRILRASGAGTGSDRGVGRELDAVLGLNPDELASQVPAFSAILPFLLLILTAIRLALPNPSPVFGLAAVLILLLLGLALLGEIDLLVPVSLACVAALEFVWHEKQFQPAAPWIPLLWYLVFYLAYSLFPFAFQKRLEKRVLPWAASALAGPVSFLLVYRTVSTGFPNGYLGLLPAAFAVPMLLALAQVARTFPQASPMRLNLMAWFGASALFFITLIFPIQFERQWMTLGWGLEGLALIWLFIRVPHPGLRATGVVLLAMAFVRLALNPAVFDYHRSASSPIFNWYLYVYGTVTVCLLQGARWLAPPRNLVWKQNMPPWLYALGTILAFVLVNIEIANYFAEGETLTFQFTGNFARDMSYSIAWALFALVLLIVGIWKRLSAVRYSAMGLLIVTLLKLFFHDLSQLGQLYRIGAFIAVAFILILASFLYQRFVSFESKDAGAKG